MGMALKLKKYGISFNHTGHGVIVFLVAVHRHTYIHTYIYTHIHIYTGAISRGTLARFLAPPKKRLGVQKTLNIETK